MTPHEKNAFIRQTLSRGEDGGALQMLAEQWLEPAVSMNAQDAGWRASSDFSESLLDCIEKTTSSEVRACAAQLIVQVVRETFASPERHGRLKDSFLQGGGYGWLNLKHLLRALKTARPEGTMELLSAIMNDASLPIRARSWALVVHGEMAGSWPACLPGIVKAMLVTQPDLGFSNDGRIKALVECGFLRLEHLCEILAQPRAGDWFEEIRGALTAEDEKIPTARLIDTLRKIVAAPAPSLNCLHFTASALHHATRTVEQTAAIVSAIKEAQAKAGTHADKEGFLSAVDALLQRFEDEESGVLRIPPNPGPEAAISITSAAYTDTVDGTDFFDVEVVLEQDIPKCRRNVKIHDSLPVELRENMLPRTYMRTRGGFAVLMLHEICRQAKIDGLSFLARTRTPEIRTLYFIEKDGFGGSRVSGYGFLLNEAAMQKASEAIARVFAWSEQNIKTLAGPDYMGAAGNADDIREAICNPVICEHLTSSSMRGATIPGHEDGDSPAYFYSWLRSVQMVIKTAQIYKQHVLHSVGVLG